MAKPLMVTLGTETFSFSLNEVERADLYGSRKRVPTDASGRTCTRAGLTQDGSLLIASGMSGQGYFNAAGQYVSRGQLVGVNAQGAVSDASCSCPASQKHGLVQGACEHVLALRLAHMTRLEQEDAS